MNATTTYEIQVYVTRTWATGTPRGTGWRTFRIEEAATICGGMRAINEAVDACNGYDLCSVAPPKMNPNPVLEGWPIG